MVNLLTLVEVANSNNRVVGSQITWPVKRSFNAGAFNLSSLEQYLKELGLSYHNVDGEMVTVVLNNKDELNRFASFYFPVLFKAQLAKAESQDKAIKRTFREVIGKIHPTPHTVIARDAIVKISARLEQCGVSLMKG